MTRFLPALGLLLLPGLALAARGDVRSFTSTPDWTAEVQVIAAPPAPWRVRPAEAARAAPARSQVSER